MVFGRFDIVLRICHSFIEKRECHVPPSDPEGRSGQVKRYGSSPKNCRHSSMVKLRLARWQAIDSQELTSISYKTTVLPPPMAAILRPSWLKEMLGAVGFNQEGPAMGGP